MRTGICWMDAGRIFRSFFPRAAVVPGILLAVLLILPSGVVASAGGDVSAGGPASAALTERDLQSAGRMTETVSPAAVVTTNPAPVPARQNRTPLVQTAKKIADRPKVTVPTGLFFVIVAVALIGLLAILFHLLRRGAGSPAAPVKPVKGPGTETIVGDTRVPGPAPDEADSPAVRFPLPIRKRFLHPEFIGEGGLARVFRAENAKTGMIVAVKVPVRFDEITGTHFIRDIAFWQAMEHENIIRILSSNILPVPYIEMEYAPSSLAAIPLPLPEDKAVGMVLAVARGLAYAHEKGIIHRDIKPENILITDTGVPKITDWGLGKVIGDTRQSTILGFSPAYAAPEQIAPHRFGRPGPATDIYQLGMLLCELLTGAPAFRGTGMHDLNTSILEDIPVIPPYDGRYGDGLEKIIRKCLAKKPEDRYTSVNALIRDLEALRQNQGS